MKSVAGNCGELSNELLGGLKTRPELALGVLPASLMVVQLGQLIGQPCQLDLEWGSPQNLLALVFPESAGGEVFLLRFGMTPLSGQESAQVRLHPTGFLQHQEILGKAVRQLLERGQRL